MEEVTYKTYLDALVIVKRYHKQILNKHDEILNAHEEIEDKLLNESGSILLKDFFALHLIPARVYNSIRKHFNLGTQNNITIDKCRVEYFLTKFLIDTRKYKNLGFIRGISPDTMKELLITFSKNGFKEYVDPLEIYY